MQVGGGAAFSNNSKSFGGFVGSGGARAFGSLAVGTTHIDFYNASGVTVGVEAGYQIPLDKKGLLQLCPGAGAGLQSGPNNISGTGVDYSATDITLGLLAGGVAARPSQVDVVPTGLIEFVNTHERLKDASGTSTSRWQSFGVLGLGLGLVFSNHVSIRPAVSIPFGISGGSTSFSVWLAVNLRGGW